MPAHGTLNIVALRPISRSGLRPLSWRAAVGIAALTTTVVGCGGSSNGPDAERFCGEIAADPAAVVAAPLDSAAALSATLEHYQMLNTLAPIGIADSWQVLIDTVETATTVVPEDPDSMQRLVAEAFAMERSAVEVHAWVLANCGVDLGPVTTIVPHGRAVTLPDEPLFIEGPDGSLEPLLPAQSEGELEPTEGD
jgi:hypothetical protein